MTNTENLEYGVEPAAPVNGVATASALVGLLACVPGTGLIGIPLAVVGLRRARSLGGAGRQAATLGLVVGLINLLWWSAVLAGALQTGRAIKKSGPMIRDTGQFVLFVGKGELDKAKAFCKPDITDAQLEALEDQINAAGQMRQPNPYYGGQVHGGDHIEIQCELTFDSGNDTAKRVLVTHWDPRGESPKLFAFELRDGPATTPALAR